MLLSRDPRHADAHFLLGAAAAAANRVGEAAKLIARAIELAPAPPAEYHAQLARCLALLRREPEALAAAERALAAAESRDALTLDTAGVVLARLGEHVRAADAFGRAVRLAPENPSFQLNYASALRMIGRFAEARTAYEAAIAAAPKLYRAHFALAELDRQTPESNHVERLERLLAEVGDDVDGELLLCHALAKEHEDLGNYDAAFGYLERGKARKRASLGYRFDGDRRLFEAVQRVCTAEWIGGTAAGHSSEEPIFVVGMPRTGTTLVERILSSHSAVTSAGELQNFGICLKRSAGTRSSRVLDEETVVHGAGIDPATLGLRYLESTRPLTGRTARFTDKMPLNFFYAGFIHRALPRAKIVCLRRHPLDTCVGNYRQLFALGFHYYSYAYDLADIGRYYAAFDRLVRHWREILPADAFLEVHYEELVREQRATTERLLRFCGLPWEDACLDFHANAAPVATASSVQVRRPLYSTSIGAWRRYEKHLGPLEAALAEEGVVVD